MPSQTTIPATASVVSTLAGTALPESDLPVRDLESGGISAADCGCLRRSWIDRACRNLLLRSLRRISTDRLTLSDHAQRDSFGGAVRKERQHGDRLNASLEVYSPEFYRRVVAAGAIGAAESYMECHWDSANLTEVFRVLLRNESTLRGMQSTISALARGFNRVSHLLNRNSRSGSRRNIQRHYDLGNSFFELFLDPLMMYSSAIFEQSDTSLADGAVAKLDRICRDLQLRQTDHLLEIGTGWGGFAVYAAENFGCRVTTTTISDEQHRMATQRVVDAGLSDRVTVLKQDYRDLTGRFDKLVSIEMIEAVGRKYLQAFFSQCARLLKDDGCMLIQAITMPEQRYARYVRSVDFIQKYIFPGGFLPSVTEMHRCASRDSDLRLLQLTDFGPHYARTLQHWNRAFHDQLAAVRELGYSERFIRMWRYYFCYCEAAFLERATSVVHMMWGKPACPIGHV